jgi:arylsulfatase A-like enzyme
MIHHPAFEGARECPAITSQLDLAPTLIGLTGREAAARARASEGLKGRDFSPWLRDPTKADTQAIRPAALFNFDMLSYQDAKWAALTIDTRKYRTKTPAEQAGFLAKHPPDFLNRTAIRSIWDGRYRFSRYFSPVGFNTPKSLEELLAMNDVEVYDLHNDPEEMNNLATDSRRNGDLIVGLNQETNRRIAEEVGEDDGRFLPIRDGKWHFPPASER